MTGLIEGFVDKIVEDAVKAQAHNLVTTWVEAGYIEAAKAPELEAGIRDMTEVVLGMMAKGQAEQK